MSDEAFAQLVEAVLKEGRLNASAIALRFSTPVSAIERWAKGEELPHPLRRDIIAKFIEPASKPRIYW